MSMLVAVSLANEQVPICFFIVFIKIKTCFGGEYVGRWCRRHRVITLVRFTMNKNKIIFTGCLLLSLIACSAPPKSYELNGLWIKESDGTTMLDPQTSGLVKIGDKLYSLSDASADKSQIKRLHVIDPVSGNIINKSDGMAFDERIRQSCFYDYLAGEPDYEALVPDPFIENSWIWVTEDASRSKQMTTACQDKYGDTGSTVYPTLLVRLTLENNSLRVTGVRPVRYNEEENVADHPNDGIEGLAITKDKTLLLGLEKDGNGNARVFSVPLDVDFFNTLAFVTAEDAGLRMPTFEKGNHPINGMDIVYREDGRGYLIAAARNDNQLWIIDLQKEKDTVIVQLQFLAPSQTSDKCEPFHLMNNSSIEGIAVDDEAIYMVNDPWKANYHKNIVCDEDKVLYQRYSPLLFKLPLNDGWF